VQRRVMTGSGGGIGAVQAAEIARAEHAPV
jgi:hypothetical protein